MALLINVFSTQDFSKFQKAGEWRVKQPQESFFLAQDWIVLPKMCLMVVQPQSDGKHPADICTKQIVQMHMD